MVFSKKEHLYQAMKAKFPCRNEAVKVLFDLIGNPEEAFPSAVLVHGHSGTGKTAIVKEFFRGVSSDEIFRTAFINCIECYTTKILLERILEEFEVETDADEIRCETIRDFVTNLRGMDKAKGYLISLDNAERLIDMDGNVLPSLMRLQSLCGGLNVCVVLMSQLTIVKYINQTIVLRDVITIHCPQYNKTEAFRILSSEFANVQQQMRNQIQSCHTATDAKQRLEIIDSIAADFFNNYLNIFLSVFYKACRDVPELKVTAYKCFAKYMEPVFEGTIETTDVSRLWRNIVGPLKVALAQVYMRYDGIREEVPTNCDRGIRHLAQTLELPYYAKYLLIAAFLASHNSAKEDKRLFVKHHGKKRKRVQSTKAKVTEKMSTSLGPKSFSIDRLLAIFYAILDEKVGLTCNLLSQISTLVQLKLLSFVSGENNVVDGSSRLQCTVGLEFVLYIGKSVHFNVQQYLCDFM